MTLGRAASVSLALHGLALLLLVAAGLLRPPTIAEPKPLARVELVEQQTPTVGAAQPAAPPTRPAPPKPVPARTRLALGHSLPLPAPPAPRPPSPAHAAAPRLTRTATQAATAGTGLVSGSQVVPAAIDRAARNLPPAYPPLAVRAGEEGSVILAVRVAPDGSGAVAIADSSGYALLDAAARTAVASWHFIPARRGGRRVPSSILIRIRFILTAASGGE